MKSVWKDALSAFPLVLSCAYTKEHPGVHALLTVVSQEPGEMFISLMASLIEQGILSLFY